MKVEELEGALLDYWVGKSEGFLSEYNPYEPENGALAFDERIGTQIRIMGSDSRLCWVRYKPSIDWAQGGPLIEKEQICIYLSCNSWQAGYDLESGDGTEDGEGLICMSYQHNGPTPLIAAMRAYVERCFGDEVADDIK